MRKCFFLLLVAASVAQAQTKLVETNLTDNIKVIKVNEQIALGYSTASGVKIIKQDGLPFKDLNKNGKLDKYEDWRLSVAERAKDLASKMTVDQIAGMMLYSRHQAIPAQERGMFAGTYKDKSFSASGAKASDLSDQQIAFLTKDNLRHVLITSVQNPVVSATWNNNVQQLVEGIGMGIPANNSSDPRNGANKDAEYNAGSGGAISQWPEELGLAATFDPAITQIIWFYCFKRISRTGYYNGTFTTN